MFAICALFLCVFATGCGDQFFHQWDESGRIDSLRPITSRDEVYRTGILQLQIILLRQLLEYSQGNALRVLLHLKPELPLLTSHQLLHLLCSSFGIFVKRDTFLTNMWAKTSSEIGLRKSCLLAGARYSCERIELLQETLLTILPFKINLLSLVSTSSLFAALADCCLALSIDQSNLRPRP